MKKIIIGILVIIVIIIAIIIGVLFSFKPSVKTMPISDANASNAMSLVQKIEAPGTHEVSLSSQDLSNAVDYAVSQNQTASKYITGVKVQPESNGNVAVYATGDLKGLSSQAKLNFKVVSSGSHPVLKYNGGKIGPVSIPQSKLFEKLHDNNYITVNKQNGTISINANAIKGKKIDGITVTKSNIKLALSSY